MMHCVLNGATHFSIPQMQSSIPLKLNSASHTQELVDEWCVEFVNPGSNTEKLKIQESKYGLLGRLCFPDSPQDKLLPASKFLSWSFLAGDSVDGNAAMDTKAFGNLWVNIMNDCGHENNVKDKQVCRKLAMFSRVWNEIASNASQAQKETISRSVSDAFSSFDIHNKWLDNKMIPSVEDYIWLRRQTIGFLPFMVTMEYTLAADLRGHEVSRTDEFMEVEKFALDHIMLSNDLLSFKKEWKSGDYYNIIPITAYNHKVSLQDAVLETCDRIRVAEERYLEARKAILVGIHGQSVPGLIQYVDGLGSMMAGSIEWCWQSARYHGIGWSPPSTNCGVINLL